jgi:hypothetical protein
MAKEAYATPTHLCQIYSSRLDTAYFAESTDGKVQVSICIDHYTNRAYYSGQIKGSTNKGILIPLSVFEPSDDYYVAKNGAYNYVINNSTLTVWGSGSEPLMQKPLISHNY